jgi:hypothetical protein
VTLLKEAFLAQDIPVANIKNVQVMGWGEDGIE